MYKLLKITSKLDWQFWLSVFILALLPFVLPYTAIGTNILIISIFAIGYNLLLGHTGPLSFGHASFYGLGAYGTGILMVKLKAPLWLAMLGGVLIATLGGAIIGYLALRRTDVYFALLTLAFSQILYFLAFQLRGLTGGDDGLCGIPYIRPFSIDLSDPLNMYYFTFIFFVFMAYIARMILRSPFGKAMEGVKENEDRAISCGFNTKIIKLISFIISSTYGGLAGSLFSIHLRMVPVDVFHWTTNGEVIFVSIVGGVGTYFGPIVGSVVFILLHDILQVVFQRWEIVVGGVLIFFILFFKKGIVGEIENQIASRRNKGFGRGKFWFYLKPKI
jgi:branched-chain amino acid transport system permease protein